MGEEISGGSANSEEEISRLFEEYLNQHGYAYQNAIVRKIEDMSELSSAKKKSFWENLGTEFPVTADKNTHIDLVCRQRFGTERGSQRYFLVGECKRSDPGRAAWCFANVPTTWGDHGGSYIQFDQIDAAVGDRFYHGNVELRSTERPIMTLGKALTTRISTKPPPREEKDPLNDAVNQVLRGVGGFINYITSKRQAGVHFDSQDVPVVVPVVFTTAEIYTTDTNIASADLRSGKLPTNTVRAKKVDWIWYNYNRSTQLSHGLQMMGKAARGYSNLFREFTRTVAIVGPAGLESFLRYDFNFR